MRIGFSKDVGTKTVIFEAGWFRGEQFKLFNIDLFTDERDFDFFSLILFRITIAKFCIYLTVQDSL